MTPQELSKRFSEIALELQKEGKENEVAILLIIDDKREGGAMNMQADASPRDIATMLVTAAEYNSVMASALMCIIGISNEKIEKRIIES
jgi:hypothetical protein